MSDAAIKRAKGINKRINQAVGVGLTQRMLGSSIHSLRSFASTQFPSIESILLAY